MDSKKSDPFLHAVLAGTASVEVPGYDRQTLSPGVVHISVGGFHRSHQSVYFDDLARQGERDWGVVGVGLHSPEMGEALAPQDQLFTVVERDRYGDRARLVGALIRYLYAPNDPEAVLEAMSAPAARLVTLTVTGAGYPVDQHGRLRVDAPDVRHDLGTAGPPTSMVGFVVEALRRRRQAGIAPFTVLSCDNLTDSGAFARAAVTGFARLRDPGLGQWVEDHVAFPSSMVDRITPETTPDVRREVSALFGLSDRWPVVTEPFRQWVIEDRFCNARPPLERVGVQFVDDVGPHKLVKARLLNGGHCAIGYLGSLVGCSTTDQVMRDEVLGNAVERMIVNEIGPLLPDVAGMDLGQYASTTLERFANPAIGDQISRLCRRGSVKMPSYLLPSLREARSAGRQHTLMIAVLAAWLRFLQGADLRGRALAIDDPMAEQLRARAGRPGADPRPVFGLRGIFGELSDDAELVDEVVECVSRIDSDGLQRVLECPSTVGDAA